MAQLKTNSFQVAENVGSVVDVLLQLYNANKSILHVERLIKGRRNTDPEISYDNLFDLQPNTNYVLRLTNVTRSNSTASFILIDDVAGGIFYKQANNANVSGTLAAGESGEYTVVVGAAPGDARLESSATIANSTPVVTSVLNGTNLNLVRGGNVVGSIPNVVSFPATPAAAYPNPYYINATFDWDWQKTGQVIDGEVQISFTFVNVQTPVSVQIDSLDWAPISIFNTPLVFPANTTPVVRFRDATNTVVEKTITVGPLPGSIPDTPTVSATAITTDETVDVIFPAGAFTLEVSIGNDIRQTIGGAVSPYNFQPQQIGLHSFKIIGSSGKSLASAIVTVTQGANIIRPDAPVPTNSTGTVGTPISGTTTENGTLIVLRNNIEVATRIVAGSAFSYTPDAIGLYKFKLSNAKGVSAESSVVTVSSAVNPCNLSDELAILYWTLAATNMVVRTFDGGLTYYFGQQVDGKSKWFFPRGKNMASRGDVNFLAGFDATVVTCITSPDTANDGLAQYEMNTPVGYDRVNSADGYYFRPSVGKVATITILENTAGVAAELAWGITPEISDVPDSRWKIPSGTPQKAVFDDVPSSGTLHSFARNRASKLKLDQIQTII